MILENLALKYQLTGGIETSITSKKYVSLSGAYSLSRPINCCANTLDAIGVPRITHLRSLISVPVPKLLSVDTIISFFLQASFSSLSTLEWYNPTDLYGISFLSLLQTSSTDSIVGTNISILPSISSNFLTISSIVLYIFYKKIKY